MARWVAAELNLTGKDPMAALTTLKRPLALTTLAAAVLAGFMVNATAQTTTLGTRGTLASDNTAISTNTNSAWAKYERSADYPRVTSLPLQYITTNKGQKLSVRVSMPANLLGLKASGKFPVILTQTAYRTGLGDLMGSVLDGGTSLIIGGKDDFMIRRGYITVAVDALGTGMSTGVTELIGEAEQEAYAETVKWITQQSWFNGNIGLAGTSYLGITSLLTAKQQHPAVKAVFANVPMGDAYRGTVGVGGLMNAKFLSVWLPLTHGMSVGLLNTAEVLLNPWLASTIRQANNDHVKALDSWYLPTVNNGLAGQAGIATDDGDFWKTRSPIEGANNIKVPTFLMGGTNDIFQRDVPLIYEQVKRNANAKLVVYPGTHLGSISTALFGAGNVPAARNILLQWFDQYLKGKNTGASAIPNVTQYVQGYGDGKFYARATDWPHPQMTPQRMFLRNGNLLSTDAPTGIEPARSFSEPPAPGIDIKRDGDTMKAEITLNDGSKCSSSFDQWSLGIPGILGGDCYKNADTVEKAQGAAIYETGPMSAPMYLNGPIQADLWVTTTKTDAAVAVRVDSVAPNGVATPISTGLQSVRHRAIDTSRSRYVNGVMIQPWHPFTRGAEQAVTPGTPTQVAVEVFPNAVVIPVGHKLRIALSASNQAQGVWPLPNQAAANGGVTAVLNNAQYPSSVVLPVVPTSALR